MKTSVAFLLILFLLALILAVRYYLAAKGIDESRIATRNYGSSFPMAGNRSAFGRQRNHRTEIILHRNPPRDN